MKHIGGQIAKRRKFLNLTQEMLADISGVSLRTIKAIELDKGNPSLGSLNKILEVLGMDFIIKVKNVE